ncbi:MAG: hypothetical protein K2G84_00510 [Muribaculaceae bacterium]|nr:hypothetical protein [Muribaculaceae bacterium]
MTILGPATTDQRELLKQLIRNEGVMRSWHWNGDVEKTEYRTSTIVIFNR